MCICAAVVGNLKLIKSLSGVDFELIDKLVEWNIYDSSSIVQRRNYQHMN